MVLSGSLLLAAAAAAPPLSSDDVLYDPPNQWPGGGRAKVPVSAGEARTLSHALSDTVSVRDFGAFGDCTCYADVWQQHCCPHDDTAAFNLALTTGVDVYVPAGNYRIDGTVELNGQTMILAGRSTLARNNISKATQPVVRLTGWFSSLRNRVSSCGA